MDTPHIAIVDPYFSGKDLRYIAEGLGYGVIAIDSNANAQMPAPKDPFFYHFAYDGNKSALLQSLQTLNVKALFAGCENGVLLADLLSFDLGLISNGVVLSAARRDKGRMKDVFQEQGVPCAGHQEFDELTRESVLQWMQTTKRPFPIVLKPAMAFGSMNVFICQDVQGVEEAVEALRNQDLSAFGIEGNKNLAEEYIDGEEYCVDVLGNGTSHFITDIWKYDRREYTKGRNAYYSCELIDPEEDKSTTEKLIDASLKAVSALQIRYGCAHVELKIGSNGEVKVLEVGARLPGGFLAQHAKIATGQDVELAHVEAFLGAEPSLMPVYSLKRRVIQVVLKSDGFGEVKSVNGLEEIEKLPSFTKRFIHCKPGDIVESTVDLVHCPGMIFLESEDREQIVADCHKCHELFSITFSDAKEELFNDVDEF